VTWLKLSDDFRKDCRRAKISADAFRLHVEGLNFAMDDENGGLFDEDDILSFSRADKPLVRAQELEDCGFWQRIGETTWQILHHMEHQPDVEVLAARRSADAERQARKRRKSAGLPTESGSLSRRDTDRDSRRDVTRDRPRDDTRDPGRVGTGLDGAGQGLALEVSGDQTGPDDDTSHPSTSPASCDWCGGKGGPEGRPCPQCGRRGQ
jgi:hypothetical protein